MFVVTVTFYVKEKYLEEFLFFMRSQAKLSLEKEKNCIQFDISLHNVEKARIFLYEVYKNEDAYKYHLETDHFHSFSAQIKDMTISKIVEPWYKINCENK